MRAQDAVNAFFCLQRGFFRVKTICRRLGCCHRDACLTGHGVTKQGIACFKPEIEKVRAVDVPDIRRDTGADLQHAALGSGDPKTVGKQAPHTYRASASGTSWPW